MAEPTRLLIPSLGKLYAAIGPFTEPAIRVVSGASLAAHGYPKLFGNTAANAAFFEQEGFHPALFWTIATGLTEFVGGLCLAAGLFTRVVAVPILIFLLTAIAYHWKFGFYWNMRGFEYPLFWAVVTLHFLVRGGGRCSIDAKLGCEV